jgi:trk system potassium uptake protein TrkH
MALIVLGGLGGIVLVELFEHAEELVRLRARPQRRLSLHTRLVLLVSGGLIVGGAVFLLAAGTPTEAGALEKVGEGFFQSITARTAGFNTVVIGTLPASSLVLLIALMFVGGSPASTAGGIKTTTLAVWLAEVWSAVRRREEAIILKRSIPPRVVRRALLLINLAVLWNFTGVLLLLVFEKQTELAFLDLLFEQISAFATVGLSTGLTPELSAASRLWIIATMFVGRLGPLLLASWALRAEPARVHHATGRVLIG